MKARSLLLLSALLLSVFTQNCHHSCSTCSGTAYTQCLTCADRSVQYGAVCDGSDQSILAQVGGICGSAAYSRGNPLGAILLIIAVLAGVFLKSQYVFYFVLSMQTLGLVGLVETAFSAGLSTLLGAFEYFMLFSVMGQNTKPQNCKLMLRSMYRLNDFLGTTSFQANAPPILAVVLVLTAALALLSIFKKVRKTSCASISDSFLDQILLGLRTALLLLMQEAILIIYVGIRFSSLNGGLVLCIILYCIAMVYLIVDCNMNPLPFFRSVEGMNLCFVKRLMLPALVMVPFKFSYTLLIFLVGFNLIDFLLLTKSNNSRTKNYIYLLLELTCFGMLGGFAITDLGNNSASQSTAIAIFATIMLVVYIVLFVVEVALAVKRKFKGGKVVNEAQ